MGYSVASTAEDVGRHHSLRAGPPCYPLAVDEFVHQLVQNVASSLRTEHWVHEVTVSSVLTAFTTRSFLEQQKLLVFRRVGLPAEWTSYRSGYAEHTRGHQYGWFRPNIPREPHSS